MRSEALDKIPLFGYPSFPQAGVPGLGYQQAGYPVSLPPHMDK